MQIAEHCVVHVNLVLKDTDGEELDRSPEGSPVAYLHGAGQMVPGVEAALAGKEAGARVNVRVTPQDGYGVRDESLVQSVPRSLFPAGAELMPGMRFQAESNHGPRLVTITEVDEDQVTVDGNHVLAGRTLDFELEVAAVRAATDEEKAHGHVHGEGGHAH